MNERFSNTVQDYLKVIYDLTCADRRAATTQIAARLGVAPASVTGMLKRLAASAPPLVEYHRHRGVRLTEPGRRAALEVIRHHRLLEQYLLERLGYTWDEVHAEADRLEHVISEEFEERIAQSLGNPSHDPHGEPIPTSDLCMPPLPSTRLSELRPGQRAVVAQVMDTDPEFLRYLSEIGLTPWAKVTVLAYSSFDGNLMIQVEGQEAERVLGPGVTGRVMVRDS
jgi:DtxR family Mn-dependent transcriptional regulator